MKRCTKRNNKLTRRFFEQHEREFDELFKILKDMEMHGAPKEVLKEVYDKALSSMKTGEEFEMCFSIMKGWKEISPEEAGLAA